MPIPVSVRFKAWVCGRSLAGVAGSNPTEGIDVCLLWVLCVKHLINVARTWIDLIYGWLLTDFNSQTSAYYNWLVCEIMLRSTLLRCTLRSHERNVSDKRELDVFVFYQMGWDNSDILRMAVKLLSWKLQASGRSANHAARLYNGDLHLSSEPFALPRPLLRECCLLLRYQYGSRNCFTFGLLYDKGGVCVRLSA
jgi:hypothetical protein